MAFWCHQVCKTKPAVSLFFCTCYRSYTDGNIIKKGEIPGLLKG